jgi:hypothetical protein
MLLNRSEKEEIEIEIEEHGAMIFLIRKKVHHLDVQDWFPSVRKVYFCG